jgi:hypothetical protein
VTHQLTLYGVTVGGTYAFGTNEYCGTGTQTRSHIGTYFTTAGTEDIRLDHYTSALVANGLGQPVGYSYEVYSRVVIVKLA